jgi:hypothetical protein
MRKERIAGNLMNSCCAVEPGLRKQFLRNITKHALYTPTSNYLMSNKTKGTGDPKARMK